MEKAPDSRTELVWSWRPIVLAGYFFVIAAAAVVHYLTVPADGIVVDDLDAPWTIADIEAGSAGELAGLRSGDRLVAIGSVPVVGSSVEDLRAFADGVSSRYRAGQTVMVRVEREGGAATLPLRFGGQSRGILASHLLLYSSLWLVACFLIWAKRGQPEIEILSITIFVVTVGQLLRLTSADVSTSPGFLIEQTGIICRAFGPVLLVNFGTVFPVATLSLRARRWLITATLGAVVPVFLLREVRLIATVMSGRSFMPGLVGSAGTIQWWATYWVAVGGVLALGLLLIRAYRRLPRKREKDQIKWMLWGIVAAGAADALLMSTVMVRMGAYPSWLDTYRNLIYMLLPVGLLLSIFRQDLFDVDTVIRSSAIYFGSTIALFVVFTGSESILSEILGGMFTMMSGTARSIVSGIVAAMVFLPIRAALERFFKPTSSPSRIGETPTEPAAG